MNIKKDIREKLIKYLEKKLENNDPYIFNEVVNFIKKDRAEQLILHGVSGMFSEKQMEEAWTDGCGCGESRSGYFDIENYR